jgi:hypothetical protein
MTQACCTGPFRNAVRVGLDCSRCMERTVQVHAVHCVSKQNSDIVASPGTMLAPALSTDREEQQQHVLTPASAKATPAHRHAHHCSICGAARHTSRRACTHALMCTHTHTLTRTHAYARIRCARDGLRQFFSVASDAPSLVVSGMSSPSFLKGSCGISALCW